MKLFRRSQWFLQARGHFAIKAFPRICISSTGGGGGKTLLSLGLCRAFDRKGLKVKPFKKGPDYIDAAWLTAAAGVPATNLDPFFMDADGLLKLFTASMSNASADLAIIEGNRGLYDGLNESGVCSTAQVARPLKCPLLLCIDCAKTTRTIAAVLQGLVSFEPDLIFAGVVLNRVGSSRHETSLRRAIEAGTDLSVLGALPRMAENPLPERHMGLAGSGEGEAGEAILERIADFVAANCDSDAILAAAGKAPLLPEAGSILPVAKKTDGPLIGVVRDKAFWFYYPENLEALERAGANIRYISMFEEPEKWQNLAGIYIGGGFPEDYAAEIAASPVLPLLRTYAEKGLPVYAECGGLVALAQDFGREGAVWQMAGVFPVHVRWSAKPSGLGYVRAKVERQNPWYPAGVEISGHEFHYSFCENGVVETYLAQERGRGLFRTGATVDGLSKNNVWASYMHIFAPAVPEWAPRFVELASRQ